MDQEFPDKLTAFTKRYRGDRDGKLRNTLWEAAAELRKLQAANEKLEARVVELEAELDQVNPPIVIPDEPVAVVAPEPIPEPAPYTPAVVEVESPPEPVEEVQPFNYEAPPEPAKKKWWS